MPTFRASVQAAQSDPTSPHAKARDLNGKVRMLVSSFTVPVGGLAIADVIEWGTLPKGARPLHNGFLSFSAGTASATLNLGDAAVPARYLAATSIATAGNAVPQAHVAAGAQFVTTEPTTKIQSVLAGAGMPVGQIVTLYLPYVQD